MFGIDDPWIILGYACTLGIALACILYGIVKWNEGAA